MSIAPKSGPVGKTTVAVSAKGFEPNEKIKVELSALGSLQSYQGPYGSENIWRSDSTGSLEAIIAVPSEICCSGGKLVINVISVARHTQAGGSAIFTITE